MSLLQASQPTKTKGEILRMRRGGEYSKFDENNQ